MDENTVSHHELHILKRHGFYGTIPPVMSIVRGTSAQASANFSTPFWRADRPYRVLGGFVRWEVAALDGSLNFVKVPSGTATASGTSILASLVDLDRPANTDVAIVLSSVMGDLFLNTGDSLSQIATGTLVNHVGNTSSILLEAI